MSSSTLCPRRLRVSVDRYISGLQAEEGSGSENANYLPIPSLSLDYTHQIGRTGRSGKTGIATTFVNLSISEQTLLDLKYLLMEAKQR